MFFGSLVAAGFQLVCGIGVFAIARTRAVWRVIVAVLVGLVGMGLSAINHVTLSQGLVLTVIGIACLCVKARRRVFAGWATAASVATLGIAGLAGVQSWVGLKERYPFESMSPRLAYEKFGQRAGLDSPILTDATRDHLKKAENWSSWSGRARALRLVHASYVEQFVASPGFGFGRMIRPSRYHIESGDRRADTFYTLDLPPDLDGSSDDAEDVTVEREQRLSTSFLGRLDTLHDEARHDFLSPDGFGYFRDRDHVAGFVPHGFLNGKPSLVTGERHAWWQTVRVNLVSLLKHQRPMAYVSRHLPNMTELRDAPVRELDGFEQRALSSLIAGEDLVSDGHLDRVRAFGSLRAATQCLTCHEVERGTLLGAFSYEFLRDPPTVPVRKSAPEGDEKLL